MEIIIDEVPRIGTQNQLSRFEKRATIILDYPEVDLLKQGKVLETSCEERQFPCPGIHFRIYRRR